MAGGERAVCVAFEKVKDRNGKQLGDDADMIPVVKVVDQVYAVAVEIN